MKKNVTPSKVEFYKDNFYAGKDGNQVKNYLFNVWIEGDEKRYSYNAADKDSPKFVVGELIEAEIEDKKGDGSWMIIKPAKKDFVKGGNYDSSGARSGMAINCCTQLAIHKIIEFKDFENQATKIIEMAKRLEKL